MSEVREICEDGIGAAASWRGSAGALDACRLYIAQQKIPDRQVPIVYCRFGEALLHKGHREDAVACARVAFAAGAGDEEVANLCAWVFSNCGRHSEAAEAYEQLLESRPHWAEGHRHASGSIDRAIFHAGTASERDPNSFEFTSPYCGTKCRFHNGSYRDGSGTTDDLRDSIDAENFD